MRESEILFYQEAVFIGDSGSYKRFQKRAAFSMWAPLRETGGERGASFIGDSEK